MPSTRLPRRRFLQSLAGSALGASLLAPLEAHAERVSRAAEALRSQPGLRPWQSLKEQYMLDPGVVYLNHASIGTMPRVVHEARTALLEVCESNPWLYMWGPPWESAREDARGALASFLGCATQDLALTHNTTEGFNLLGNGLPLAPGEEVLFTSLNHAGASVTWEHNARRRGFSVRSVSFPIREVPGLSEDDVVRLHLEALSPATRVLVFPHVDNMVGLRHPMERLAREARAAGVEFVAVDAAQSAGMIPVDLGHTGVDLYAGSPHKWIQAAKGLGFAFLAPGLRDRVEPSWVTWGQARWSGLARRFEDYGTRNLAETVNLADAVVFQQGLAPGREDRYRELRAWMRQRVEASPTLYWRSPSSWEAGGSLVAVEVSGQDARAVAGELWERHRIVVRGFGPPLNAVRISPQLMNSEDEIESLLRILEALA
jgi:selenocysteine lyase/cysteine desulfurase